MTTSRPSFRSIALPVLVVLFTVLGMSMHVSAAPATVTWPAFRNISNTPAKSVFPVVAYDAAGAMHVAWEELGSTTASVFYTNNVSGSFRDPLEVSSAAARTSSYPLAIAVEGGRVHIVFVADDQTMRHRLITLDGARPTLGAITALSRSKSTNPTVVVDSNGQVHAAWMENRGDVYQIYHRIWTNGVWEGGSRAVRPNGRFQASPILTATRDGRVYAIYKNDTALGFSIFSGNSWQDGPNPGSGTTYHQSIASDGTNLYAVWSRSSHEVYFARWTGTWSGEVRLGSVRSDFPSIAYSPANDKVYVTWSLDEGRGGRIVAQELTPNGGFSDIQVLGGSATSWPRVAAGSISAAIVWQDKAGGAEEVFLSTVKLEPKQVLPIGTITITPKFEALLKGPGVASPFDITVTNSGGEARTVILSVDGTELKNESFSDPSKTFSGISLPTLTSPCQQKTINGTLIGPGGTSNFSTQVWVDRAVDASIAFVDQGRGDPTYTNGSNPIRLRIASGPDECSGLNTYTIDFKSTPDSQDPPANPTQTFAIPTGATVDVQVPSGPDGEYVFDLTLVDKAGNTIIFPGNKVTKDTTNPRIRLVSGDTITMTRESGSIVLLDLSGIRADDNYDSGVPNRHYWGIRLLSQRANLAAPSPTDPVWSSRGVVVPGIAPDSLRWNVLMGLGGDFVEREDYKIYVQVLDAAGNPSEVFATNSLQINQATGRVFLPAILN